MSKGVIIIGGGVIGLCTAYYCARAGLTVTVIDRNPRQRDGCSFGNAGILAASHVVPLAAPGMIGLGLKWMWNPASPFYIKPRLDADLFSWAIKFWRAANADHVRRAAPLLRDLMLASRRCFEELASVPDADFRLERKGLLMLCKEQHALDEEAKAAEQARALGMPAEVLNPGQVAALDPGLRVEIAGAVYFPLDCHLSPARFMAALQRQCELAGVTFVWNSDVVDFHVESRRIQSLKVSGSEDLAGDEFVLCGGSWSPLLARKAGLNIPIQAGKGYSLTLPRPRRLPQICSILVEARVAVTPMDGALRVGGTMEIAGMNEEVNPIRVQGIVDSFCRYFPEFGRDDFERIQPWRGLRPCSPDGLPYVGRTKNTENLSLATGHAMIGLSLGPITGKLVAENLCNGRPSIDITMLSPDRYA